MTQVKEMTNSELNQERKQTMNRSQLKAKANRRVVRSRFRETYGKDMWLDVYLSWLRGQRGEL